ncbi:MULTISPECIES: M15 family metallopeptidase [unclassified Streptomyces]|uniref:M15 family metallopeptidase n=1 Tax=unclassified Streptomyces TaxID=2593676 RepID=UPI00340CBB0D
MEEIVLMADPRVASIPVRECGERLVDIRSSSRLLVDERKQDTGEAFAYLRKGVVERLEQAQSSLPDGLRLLIVEGYRSPHLQQRYFEEYADTLRTDHPDWSGERIRSAASRYVSPPEIAPHSAGAAVDLTLADAEGVELDLGTPMNATPEESAGACYTQAVNISAQASENRDILAASLTSAGLVNYPTEWWHWSYGDRYWALATATPFAHYGPREIDGDTGRRIAVRQSGRPTVPDAEG